MNFEPEAVLKTAERPQAWWCAPFSQVSLHSGIFKSVCEVEKVRQEARNLCALLASG